MTDQPFRYFSVFMVTGNEVRVVAREFNPANGALHFFHLEEGHTWFCCAKGGWFSVLEYTNKPKDW